MKKQFQISCFRLSIYFTVLKKRTGVCSQIAEDKEKHILLWDFDNVKLSKINRDLKKIQSKYKLPMIFIIESSKSNYHAYCFTARTLREIIHILSATPDIDMKYLCLGMVRGYYTLRISKRYYETFALANVLWSKYPNETEFDSPTITEYLSANKGGKNA